DETFDRGPGVLRFRFLEPVAELLANLFQERLHRGEEQGTVIDLEDKAEIGAFAQVKIVAGQGDAADQGRTECSTQTGATQTELPLVALLQSVIAASDFVSADQSGAPFVELVVEF